MLADNYFFPFPKPVVQKYGGTSVGTPERISNVAARVAQHYKAGQRELAIVVSAMSGETNRLVELVRQVNPDAPARFYDMAVAAGEQVAVALMAAALEKHGVPGEALLAYQLGIVTDELHAKARIQHIRTEKIHQAWREGRIPVIAGFQGMTKYGEITTLGRGGSDTSAVALAVALEAGFCEINTDVDGVYTADPRIVPDARLSEIMDFDVALEMASLGSKVLHARCVELGAKYKMPIVVRNTFKEDQSKRTVIMAFNEAQALEAPVVSGVTLDGNVAKLTVEYPIEQSDLISKLFTKIADLGVNVDIIVHDNAKHEQTCTLGFTVGRDDLRSTTKALDEFAAGNKDKFTYRAEQGLVKVSIVGLGMRSHPGVASKMFRALTTRNIALHMISTSEIKVSCVIDEKHAAAASQALHTAFVENN